VPPWFKDTFSFVVLHEYKESTASMNMQVCFHVTLLIVSPSKAICSDGIMCSIT
jgi:hypothetical protein